ncbi:TOMM precursor leader peptide-binding protein [Agreia sp. COWG]|uniref:TOMM precursor leader peptide-binding protein n=1 Tax=Agreia sp. COWG TaxID=2773266 RepID=UPI001925F2B6|nr:TOMM precursor leader peptide-binding protein [Agreia sp. COWG]CAD6001566.1 Bacteriocin biosynthesis cyclodehydratase domain-containing protein [Agreia sp. COWG]
MALQIDPRHPVIWRTPTSVQIGADRAIVTLDDVTVPEERLLSVLRKGISRTGLTMIAEEAGAGVDCTEGLLERLRPALRQSGSHNGRLTPFSLAVTGTGSGASAIRSVLSGLGATIVTDVDEADKRPDLAVIVSTFDTDPRDAGAWLREDVPHLAVVFGDSEVRIGPLVEPGRGPCLHCVGRSRIDTDPYWPALASQLLGREASTEEPVTISNVVAIVARAVLDRFDPASAGDRQYRLRARGVIVDGETGEVSERRYRAHPECACREVPPAGI